MVKKRVDQAIISDVAAFIEQANPNRPRPVKLQINGSGAWRDVIGFDASNDATNVEVMDAAATIARVGGATCRIVMAGPDQGRSPHVLMHWSTDHGWKATRNG